MSPRMEDTPEDVLKQEGKQNLVREVLELRAQVETLTAELYETRRLHGKHILDASSQISALEADRDQWREAHTREYEARIATEMEQSAAVSARAAAEAGLVEAREALEKITVYSRESHIQQIARAALEQKS